MTDGAVLDLFLWPPQYVLVYAKGRPQAAGWDGVPTDGITPGENELLWPDEELVS